MANADDAGFHDIVANTLDMILDHVLALQRHTLALQTIVERAQLATRVKSTRSCERSPMPQGIRRRRISDVEMPPARDGESRRGLAHYSEPVKEQQ